MNEASNHTAFFRGLRQMFGVTLILLLLCGFVFPVLLTGISSMVFPAQAGGSLVYADGRAVGSKYVGQEFTKPYFMKGRPSAYHYNTYYEDAQGNRYYSDGSPFAGVSSGSNNYAPSNPALIERVKADILRQARRPSFSLCRPFRRNFSGPKLSMLKRSTSRRTPLLFRCFGFDIIRGFTLSASAQGTTLRDSSKMSCRCSSSG